MQYISRILVFIALIFFTGDSFVVHDPGLKGKSAANFVHLTVKQQFYKFIEDGKCDDALKLFDKLKKKLIEKKEWIEYAGNLVKVANCYRKIDIEKTRNLVNDAEQIIQSHSINDSLLLSDILYQKGYIALEDKDYQSSLQLYAKTIESREKLKIDTDSFLPISYNNMAIAYYMLKKYEKAIEYYKQAVEASTRIGLSKDSVLADYYQNIALTYYLKKEFENSRKWIVKTLSIREKNINRDAVNMSNLYSTAGLISKELGKYDESMDYYNKAEKVALSKYNSFDMFMGRLYTNKGLLYKLKGDYNKSKQYLFYATKVYEQNVITYNPNLGTAYNLIGRIYQATCQYIKAMEYFLKGIDNVKSIKYKNSQYQDLSSLYFNCAECEDSLKNYDLSEKYYNLAISYSINDNRTDTVLLGKEYFSYGIFCMRIKEFSKGNKLFFKGYNILLKKLGGKHLFISEALKQLADYYMYRNDLQTALKYYQKSIIAITGDFEDTDIYRNPGLQNVLSDVTLSAILKNKAECFSGLFGKTRRLSDLEMSLNTYELTISLIEKLRSQYLTEESKLFLTENETSTFAKAIRVATDLFLKTGKCEYRDKAFALAEKNKSANLLSSIRQVEANTFGGIPDSLQVKEKQFKEDIAYLNNLIYNEKLGKNNKSKINEWEKKIFELNNRYDTLVSFFEKQYSSFYALKYNDEIINISGLQSKLNSKQTLVEYVLTDSVLYVFICDSSNFREITVRIDSAFFINLDYVIKAISVNDFENYTVSRFVEYANSAYYVYSKLLLPVEEYIKTGELVIVPDGNISYLPFEALVYNNVIEGRKSFRAIKYLIYKYTFSYSYSATLLFNKTGRNYSTNTLIAFAPEYDNLDKLDSAHLQAIKNFRNSLQNLPYVDNEISEIRHIVGGRSFKGNEATEDNFKADASASGIIHLAMHSVIDPENPMYSKLVFTQTNDGKEDGLLNAFEIYNLQLEAKLAVLSACNTGYGKLEKGEGVMSFARGFLYAGCKSILMTLWTVEDKSGYLLTSAFYRELNEGKNVNEALRSAKLEFLKNADQLRSHPYFWAAYVNIGSTDKVFTERRSNYNYVPLIFISVAVIIFILIISRKSIKRRFISHVNITDDNFELF